MKQRLQKCSFKTMKGEKVSFHNWTRVFLKEIENNVQANEYRIGILKI